MNKTFILHKSTIFGKIVLYLGRNSDSDTTTYLGRNMAILSHAFTDPAFYWNSADTKLCFLNCGENIGNLPARQFSNSLSLDYLPYTNMYLF